MYTVQLNPQVFNTVSSPLPAFLAVPEAYRNKLRVTLDTMDGGPANNEWSPKPVSRGFADAPIVRERRALYIGVHPIQLIDSIIEVGWTGNSYVARLLAHYIDTQLIQVKKDGNVVSSATLRTYIKDA